MRQMQGQVQEMAAAASSRNRRLPSGPSPNWRRRRLRSAFVGFAAEPDPGTGRAVCAFFNPLVSVRRVARYQFSCRN
jgi:hypothetical protein